MRLFGDLKQDKRGIRLLKVGGALGLLIGAMICLIVMLLPESRVEALLAANIMLGIAAYLTFTSFKAQAEANHRGEPNG